MSAPVRVALDHPDHVIGQLPPTVPLYGHLVIGLPLRAASVPHVRNLTMDFLVRWHVPRVVREDAEVVASELIGNAVRHTDGPMVRTDIACFRRRVAIVVTDGGPRRGPLPFGGGDLWDSDGRGLCIVAALAQEHGHYAIGTATVAWAVVTW